MYSEILTQRVRVTSRMSLIFPPPSPSSEKEGLESPSSSISDETFSYTPEEERRVYWKLNLTVLPLLFLGFYVFQLERGNISNALTDGWVLRQTTTDISFLARIGISQDQFNNGQSLLYIGIILLEVPSNYILQLIGPRVSLWNSTVSLILDMDFIPSTSFWSSRDFPSFPTQLFYLPLHSYPPRHNRMRLHSRIPIHPLNILQAKRTRHCLCYILPG